MAKDFVSLVTICFVKK